MCRLQFERFPLVNQPVNPKNPMEVEIFVASALDFRNQVMTVNGAKRYSNKLNGTIMLRIFVIFFCSSMTNSDPRWFPFSFLQEIIVRFLQQLMSP